MASRNKSDVSTRSLAAAASNQFYFERACLFNRRADVWLGEGFAGHAGGHFFRKVDLTTAVRNYTLKNVLLDADTLLLFQQGEAIAETAYFEPASAVTRLSGDIEAVLVSEAEDLIFGFNNAHRGYQHWLTQCIPAIDWSLRQPRTRSVRLVLPFLEDWQEDFLRILGYDEVPRLLPRENRRYHLPQVEYSEFLNGTVSFGVSLSLRETAQRILEAVPISGSFARVLYVPGMSQYYGSIQNESQVITLLQSRGVCIVDRGLCTADRINLFRFADAVIGPLGQGLTDIVFCRPGALLWEWMPRHHQNASFNRLAQSVQVDYWGDLFDSVDNPRSPGDWTVDIPLIVDRLVHLAARLAPPTLSAVPQNEKRCKTLEAPVGRPLDELMLEFESLGDNCEFGLVQRLAGVEPLGLLRFAGFFLPVEDRLQKLAAALERRFEGLGDPNTIVAHLAGEPGRREFIVRESVYDLMYHTFISEGEIDPEVLVDHEVKRLGFLRQKLMADLAAGEKIWVWRSHITSQPSEVMPLMDVLRRFGPNTLLWVAEADAEHAAGTIEPLEPGLIKGYVRRFAPYANAADIHAASWFEVCGRALDFHCATRSSG